MVLVKQLTVKRKLSDIVANAGSSLRFPLKSSVRFHKILLLAPFTILVMLLIFVNAPIKYFEDITWRRVLNHSIYRAMASV